MSEWSLISFIVMIVTLLLAGMGLILWIICVIGDKRDVNLSNETLTAFGYTWRTIGLVLLIFNIIWANVQKDTMQAKYFTSLETQLAEATAELEKVPNYCKDVYQRDVDILTEKIEHEKANMTKEQWVAYFDINGYNK